MSKILFPEMENKLETVKNFAEKLKMAAFAWSPIRRLMRNEGAEIVARDAVDRLINHLEKLSKALTMKAIQYSHHAGRKKVTTKDIELAIKLMK